MFSRTAASSRTATAVRQTRPQFYASLGALPLGSARRADQSFSFFVRAPYLQPGPHFESLNQGRSYEDILKLGYQGYASFPVKRERHEGGVLSALMRRVPPRSPPDFAEYKRQFRLPPSLYVSNFGLLGRTEAKLPSDGFSIVDPLDGGAAHCDLMLEIAGHRYHAENTRLLVGDQAAFVLEPDNPRDPNAVMVQAAEHCIGYINRLQATAFHQWLAEREVTGVIERLSDRDRPRAFIFVRVRPTAVDMAA